MSIPDPLRDVGPLPERVNAGTLLSRAAAEWPEQTAVRSVRRGGRSITFAGLEALANALANGLRARGVRKGDRASLFVPPGVELLALTYALFKLGAVPVLIDPGMGRKQLLACIEKVRPRVLIGVPRAHVARRLNPKSFESVRLAVTVGSRIPWGGTTLGRLKSGRPERFRIEDTAADDLAAILFTSGSTGPPKGVHYTHGMIHAQVIALGRLYRFEPGEVDLCCFPLFALYDVAFGMTTVFPDLDLTQPASCDPRKLYGALVSTAATTTFGSPSIWRKVVPWCIENGLKLEGLRRVLVAGAPVSFELIKAFHAVLPVDGDCDVYIPYGSTEALPVAAVDGRDIVPALVEDIFAGGGTCVGVPAPGIELRLIEITDEAIHEWSEALVVDEGEIGEIVVHGPVVSPAYVGEPEHTAAAKIRHFDGTIWHRMGDVGRIDSMGRLWFLGRKSHRLKTRAGTRLPVPTENVFNTHPRVVRTALVGVGAPEEELPVLVVEPMPGHLPRGEAMAEGFIMQLQAIGKKHAVSSDVEVFLFHPSFPVDVRHNAKIHREELKEWAREALA